MGRQYRIAKPASHTPVDAAIGVLAARQHGSVTYEQLTELGLKRAAILRRVQAGRLYRVHHRVYSVGRRPVTPIERASAAVLACGPGAALSHSSAMTLWGFYKRWDTPFDVVVPTDRRPKGIKVHRSSTLARRDIKTQLGIRVTSPARTVYDMAPRLRAKTLANVINDALRSYLTKQALAEIVARFPNTKAAAQLRPFVHHIGGPTRSELERGFLAFCERHGLPKPITNHPIAGHLADAYFPDHGLIIELDGWEFHNSRQAFEADRDRDADTLLAGLATVRITNERIKHTPQREADRLKRILEAQQRRVSSYGR